MCRQHKASRERGVGCVAGVGVGAPIRHLAVQGGSPRGTALPRLGGPAERQHLLVLLAGRDEGFWQAVSGGQDVGDVIADRQSCRVRTLADNVSDHPVWARDDVVTVALVGATSVSSSDHALTQSDGCFWNNPNTPRVDKFLELVLR